MMCRCVFSNTNERSTSICKWNMKRIPDTCMVSQCRKNKSSFGGYGFPTALQTNDVPWMCLGASVCFGYPIIASVSYCIRAPVSSHWDPQATLWVTQASCQERFIWCYYSAWACLSSIENQNLLKMKHHLFGRYVSEQTDKIMEKLSAMLLERMWCLVIEFRIVFM